MRLDCEDYDDFVASDKLGCSQVINSEDANEDITVGEIVQALFIAHKQTGYKWYDRAIDGFYYKIIGSIVYVVPVLAS